MFLLEDAFFSAITSIEYKGKSAVLLCACASPLMALSGVVVSISSTSAGVAYTSLARDFNDLVPSFSDRRYLTSVTRVPVFITLNHFLDWQIWKYQAIYRGILLIFVKWRRMKNCGDPIRVKNRRNDRGRRLLQTVEHVCARYIESADRK